MNDLPVRVAWFQMGLIFLSILLLTGCSSDGSLQFRNHGCIQCHRFQGEGSMRGPDLTTVGQRLSEEYIDNYIRDPRSVDPQARMPSFPELTRRERRAIIAYLTKWTGHATSRFRPYQGKPQAKSTWGVFFISKQYHRTMPRNLLDSLYKYFFYDAQP